MNIVIVTCPRCGSRAYLYQNENRMVCDSCGCIIWNYLNK